MSSLSTLPKGDSAWLLRKSIQRIMQQVSVLETNIGSSTTGNSANTQVIFNDAGTLRGDAGLTYNKATDTLSTGSATITGDLTVDTSTFKVDSANNRVGIGTATPIAGSRLDVRSAIGTGTDIQSLAVIDTSPLAINNGGGISFGYVFEAPSTVIGRAGYIKTIKENATDGNYASAMVFGVTANGASTAERYRIGSDGTATWSNVGGVAGTAMTLNSTGLGVGGSPTNNLAVQTSSAKGGIHINYSGSTIGLLGIVNPGVSNNTIIGSVSNNSLELMTNNSTKATIDSSGNVGIGVVPSAWVAGAKALQFGAYGSLAQSSSGNIELSFNSYNSGAGAYKYLQTDTASLYRASSVHSWFVAPSGTAGNAITFTQAMTLDASGKLNLGVASPYNAARLTVQSAGGAGGISVAIQNDDDSYYAINFRNSSGTSCGSISCTTSSTSFNVSSDYRLKEAVQPLTGGLTRVNALKPSIYKWKVNGSTGEGFIAHELADVVPFAVTGDKDAVDADGKPSYQGVDLSKLVPILVAAIQELTARVQTLEAK
jgi:hypothetical protein